MKQLTLLIFAFFLLSTSMNAQFRFGAGGQLILDDALVGIQGKVLYNVNEQIDAAGTFTLHLGNRADWTLDFDGHYLLLEISDDFTVKPLAGLSITRYGYFGGSDMDVGINLGAFIDVLKSGDIQFYAEPKLNIGGYGALVFSGGVLF